MPRPRTVFVAMEFGGIHDRIYDLAIKPAITQAGYHSYRADASGINREIMNDRIIRPMQLAEVGLFDVSTNNPNVLWELGYSRCLGLPSFVTTYGSLDRTPFDIRSSTVIKYSWSARPFLYQFE
jgi:hypothetical protein